MNDGDFKAAWWVAVVFGTLLTLVGLAGVWLQGPFFEKGFPTPATHQEMWLAFTLPVALTTAGSMAVTCILLASPLTSAWSARRRLFACAAFVLLVLATCFICGRLAADRVAGLLN